MTNIQIVLCDMHQHIAVGMDKGLRKEDVEDIIQDCYLAILNSGIAIENVKMSSIDEVIRKAICVEAYRRSLDDQSKLEYSLDSMEHDKFIYTMFSNSGNHDILTGFLKSLYLPDDQYNITYLYYLKNCSIASIANMKNVLPDFVIDEPYTARKMYVKETLGLVMKLLRTPRCIKLLREIYDIRENRIPKDML